MDNFAQLLALKFRPVLLINDVDRSDGAAENQQDAGHVVPVNHLLIQEADAKQQVDKDVRTGFSAEEREISLRLLHGPVAKHKATRHGERSDPPDQVLHVRAPASGALLLDLAEAEFLDG